MFFKSEVAKLWTIKGLAREQPLTRVCKGKQNSCDLDSVPYLNLPRKKWSKQFTFGISYPLFHWTTSPSYKTYLRGSHVNDGYWNKLRSDQHLLHRKSYYADKRETYQSSSHYIRRKHVQQSPSTTNARLESQNKTHCTVTLFLPSRNLQAVKQLRWPRLRKPDLHSTKLVDLHPVERFKNLEWDELSKVMSNVSASWLVEPFFVLRNYDLSWGRMLPSAVHMLYIRIE